MLGDHTLANLCSRRMSLLHMADNVYSVQVLCSSGTVLMMLCQIVGEKVAL